MNKKRKCLVGHDDNDSGWIVGLAIAIFVIMTIIALMVYGGAFIGLFHSIKNYFASFKHHVIDSNRKPIPVN